MPAKKQTNRVTKRQLSTAMEWVADRAKTSTVQKKLKYRSVNHTIYCMAIALRQAYRDGLLKDASASIAPPAA
jgi:hypothetical protein